jgi:hypothetical protein
MANIADMHYDYDYDNDKKQDTKLVLEFLPQNSQEGLECKYHSIKACSYTVDMVVI